MVNSGMPGVTRVFREMEKQKDRMAKVYPLEETLLGKVAIPDTVDTVVFGAYDGRYSQLNFPTEKKYCLWTSPIAQSEMEPFELEAIVGIKGLVENGELDGICFGSPDWLRLFPKDEKKYFYAPYPISLKRPPAQPPIKDGQTHVSMFGPTHMRKNFYNQVAAVKAAGAILHTNRMDEMQERFCKAMGVNFVKHSWMPEKEYYQIVQNMTMGLQVSHCGVESLSYVWIDHLLMGVPCLTSNDDAPAQLHCLPNDLHRMTQKIREGFESEDWRQWVSIYAGNRNKLFNKTMSEHGM